MNNYHNRQRSQRHPSNPSLIGMIRARKLAIKIKRRAQFLVADRKRRENSGKSILVHHDIPESRSIKLLKLNEGRFLTSSDGRQVAVSSRQYLTHSSRDIEGNNGKKYSRPVREYKTAPDHIFPELSIESDIGKILEIRLNGMKYSPVMCKEISKSLAEEIKKEVQRRYELKRYKLICVVNIGEMKPLSSGSVRFGSRCLWNTMFDNFASSFYQNTQVFAVAALYGVYYD